MFRELSIIKIIGYIRIYRWLDMYECSGFPNKYIWFGACSQWATKVGRGGGHWLFEFGYQLLKYSPTFLQRTTLDFAFHGCPRTAHWNQLLVMDFSEIHVLYFTIWLFWDVLRTIWNACNGYLIQQEPVNTRACMRVGGGGCIAYKIKL